MKKLYKNPVVAIREMEAEEILAGSGLNLTEEGGQATFIQQDAQGAALSRQSSWDAEE